MEMKCPCDKKCANRSSNCHANCKQYKEWKHEHEKAKEQFRLKNRNPNSGGRWVKTQDGYWRIFK